MVWTIKSVTGEGLNQVFKLTESFYDSTYSNWSSNEFNIQIVTADSLIILGEPIVFQNYTQRVKRYWPVNSPEILGWPFTLKRNIGMTSYYYSMTGNTYSFNRIATLIDCTIN